MNTFLKTVALLGLLVTGFAGPLHAQDDSGDQDVSFQNFYDQLGSQGSWIQTDDYGYVFQPNVSDPDWSPYSDGQWVYTDAGWTWDSNEPWGWATYHYGRWANIDGTGWVWVPGYTWAPAWVSWRYGGGYCGWAPLPPESFGGAEYGDNVGIGFHFGDDVDVNFHIGAGCYNFVREDDMGAPDYRRVMVNRYNNYDIINRTRNITNINVNRNGHGNDRFRDVSVGGPSFDEINAHAHQPIQRMQLTASNQPGRANRQGNSLAVYAPRVDPNSAHTARPTAVAATVNHPSFNRGDNVTKPFNTTRTLTEPAASPEAVQKAQAAESHAPATARIATEKTPMKSTLHGPLTSMQPVSQPHANGNGESHPNTPAPGSNPGGVNPAASNFHPNTPENGQAPPTENKVPDHVSNVDRSATGEPSHNAPSVDRAATGEPTPQHTAPAAPTFHPQAQATGGEEHHEKEHHTEAPGNGGGNVPHTEQAVPHTEQAAPHADNPPSHASEPAPHADNPPSHASEPAPHPQAATVDHSPSGGPGGGGNHPQGGGDKKPADKGGDKPAPKANDKKDGH